MKRIDEGTLQIITWIIILSAAALLLWNLSFRMADAAPSTRTCYVYPVRLHHVSCFAGWCSSWEDVHINGRVVLTVRVTGWRLRNGMTRFVDVCR